MGVEMALKMGRRGLPGGSSLARLLAKHRAVRNHKALPAFRIKVILSWARSHRKQIGRWPTNLSGPIDATGETWAKVDTSLRVGTRGLLGGSSLSKLLRGIRANRRVKRSRA